MGSDEIVMRKAAMLAGRMARVVLQMQELRRQLSAHDAELRTLAAEIRALEPAGDFPQGPPESISTGRPYVYGTPQEFSAKHRE